MNNEQGLFSLAFSFFLGFAEPDQQMNENKTQIAQREGKDGRFWFILEGGGEKDDRTDGGRGRTFVRCQQAKKLNRRTCNATSRCRQVTLLLSSGSIAGMSSFVGVSVGCVDSRLQACR